MLEGKRDEDVGCPIDAGFKEDLHPKARGRRAFRWTEMGAISLIARFVGPRQAATGFAATNDAIRVLWRGRKQGQRS